MKENQKKLLLYLRSNSPLTISAPKLSKLVPFEIKTYKTVKGKRVLKGTELRPISRQAMRKQLLKLQEQGYLIADYTSTQYPVITTLKKRLK